MPINYSSCTHPSTVLLTRPKMMHPPARRGFASSYEHCCFAEVRKSWCTKVGCVGSSRHRGEARVWEVSHRNSLTIGRMPYNRDTTPRQEEGDLPWYRLRPHPTCTRIIKTQVFRGPTSREVRSSEIEFRAYPVCERYTRGTERNP
jgi:hypothetical protein